MRFIKHEEVLPFAVDGGTMGIMKLVSDETVNLLSQCYSPQAVLTKCNLHVTVSL